MVEKSLFCVSVDRCVMPLTKSFKLSEFAVSKDHPFVASLINFSEADKAKLFYLCSLILQPVRDQFGPVKILSGKRSPELNKAVGGVVYSDHLFKFVSVAADFTCPDIDIERVWHWIQGDNWLKRKNRQPFGQLIYYPSKNFIHVSLPTPKHHGEVLAL